MLRQRLSLVILCFLLLITAACREPAPGPLIAEMPPALTPAAYPGLEDASPTTAAYPGTDPATATVELAYPIVVTPRPATPTPGSSPTLTAGDVYLPFVGRDDEGIPLVAATPQLLGTPTPTAMPTPTATPTLPPPLDFDTIRAQLQASGQDLAYVKIGFHTGAGGNIEGLEEWMRTLDAAGIPFFLKSVDDAGPIYAAQQLMKASGVPHTLVFRRATGDIYDVPEYHLPPEEAAVYHWERHLAIFPPELDRELVWFETINEVDKEQSEWLARFALRTAELALSQGYKWAAFGWSSGEPEPQHWQSPAMLQFLRLAGQNPDRLAIALHEYSYLVDNIGHEYPYKVGRFQELFRICDQHGIPRPTVLITEWGWTYQNVPTPDRAISDIAWAGRLYAPYPQVKGAAIWYLGGEFGRVADQAQRLIRPLLAYSLTNYFSAPPPSTQAPIQPDLYRP